LHLAAFAPAILPQSRRRHREMRDCIFTFATFLSPRPLKSGKPCGLDQPGVPGMGKSDGHASPAGASTRSGRACGKDVFVPCASRGFHALREGLWSLKK
jgi:hypothetical protein